MCTIDIHVIQLHDDKVFVTNDFHYQHSITFHLTFILHYFVTEYHQICRNH